MAECCANNIRRFFSQSPANMSLFPDLSQLEHRGLRSGFKWSALATGA